MTRFLVRQSRLALFGIAALLLTAVPNGAEAVDFFDGSFSTKGGYGGDVANVKFSKPESRFSVPAFVIVPP